MGESGPNPLLFKELYNTTILTLWTTKAINQAIGCSMVLERHLWLNLIELAGSLFAKPSTAEPEHYITVQKSSQALRYFLPKRASSSTASSRSRMVTTTQQWPRLVSESIQPQPKPKLKSSHVIEQGYSLKFVRRPPWFKGVIHSDGLRRQFSDPPSQSSVSAHKKCCGESSHGMESGFYSRYFPVHKKDGSLRRILDQRLNLVWNLTSRYGRSECIHSPWRCQYQ